MNDKVSALSTAEWIPVKIKSSLEKPSTLGRVELMTWSKSDRSRRALKFLGTCWGIGLFSVILPLIHFVLVPGMLILGLVGFVRISAQENLILGGEGVCPECAKPFRIAKATYRFPMDELCEHCKSSVSLSRAE